MSFVSNGNVGLCHEYNKINRSIDRKYTYPYNENPRLEEYVSARDELLTTEKQTLRIDTDRTERTDSSIYTVGSGVWKWEEGAATGTGFVVRAPLNQGRGGEDKQTRSNTHLLTHTQCILYIYIYARGSVTYISRRRQSVCTIITRQCK